MPKRLRKAIDKLSAKRKGRNKDDTQPSDHQDTKSNPQASFLGLPPEIRNEIYEELAQATTLHLWPTKDRKPPPPVGLLLACRQTHQEYRALLLSQAQFLISVADYNFSNLVRVLEKLNENDISLLKQNCQMWILLSIAHVPSRDDRKNLRGWCDYRGSESSRPYFGPGRAAAKDLNFEYDVKFLSQIRPPRPMCRYANGYQMKLDLLRSHLRMYNRLQTAAEEEEAPNEELKRLRLNIAQCIELFEDLHIQRFEQSLRSCSISTTQSALASPESTTRVGD